ncbi:MAG: hypothetical protein IJD60_13135 [Clostridia bacterium]|nr:hypothetical protein [Clostridia bacterium]
MLTSFETKISLQTPLFLLTAADFVLTRCGVISAAGRKSLSSLLIAFILPCNTTATRPSPPASSSSRRC